MRRIIVLTILVAFIVFTLVMNHFLSGSVSFGIIADVHKDIMHDADQRLVKFVEQMNQHEVDYTIQLGDFCRPYSANDTFMEIWNSFHGPNYHVLGNHDMDGGFTREQTMSYWGMPEKYYSFVQKGFRFIVLDGNDTMNPPQVGYAHFIGVEQFEWLKEELNGNSMPVVIFSHQSLHDPWAVENGEAIRQILEENNRQNENGRVIACFNGHSHYDGAEERNGIWYIQVNSMSYQWLGDEFLHIRYSSEIDSLYPWIKYTAPYKDPLFARVTISKIGKIRIRGTTTEFVGPSPWELGFPEAHKESMIPGISDRVLKF